MNSTDLKKILDDSSKGVQDKKKYRELLKMTNRGLLELNKIFGAILSEVEAEKMKGHVKNIQRKKITKP